MTSPSGYLGLTLNGVVIRSSTQAPAERRRELKSVLTGGPGGAREHLAWRAAGYPVRTFKRSWSFSWAHIRNHVDEIEELLADSGPHRLCFWKFVHYAWLGDGSRTEFFLPHDQIVGDSAVNAILTETPHGPIEDYEPIVKVGLSGTELTFSSEESGEYATGPGAGEVYFLNGGASFKLESAPSNGSLIFARYVPYFAVLEQGEIEKRYPDNAREPRSLQLVEV